MAKPPATRRTNNEFRTVRMVPFTCSSFVGPGKQSVGMRQIRISQIVKFRLRTSSLALRGNGKTAAITEGFGRDLKAGCGLLTLIFCAIDEANHAVKDPNGRTAGRGKG